jgi:hypothetical protein
MGISLEKIVKFMLMANAYRICDCIIKSSLGNGRVSRVEGRRSRVEGHKSRVIGRGSKVEVEGQKSRVEKY